MKGFGFFLLPLYTAYLTTKDFGITSIASSFIGTVGFIVAFSLFSAVLRFYVEFKDNPEKLKRFYGTIITFVFLSSIAFFLLFTVFRKILSKYVFAGEAYYPIILITLLSLVFDCQQIIFDRILKSQQKAFKSSVLSIVSFFIRIGFNVYFVVIKRMGAAGSLLANLLTSIIYTVYFTIYIVVHHEVHYCLDWGLLRRALRYSIPIMPHNLSTQIASLISKVLIGGKQSLAALGIYSVASQFGNLAETFHGYVGMAYGPWLYERLHDNENSEETIRSISKILIAVLGLPFIGIALFSHEYIILLLDSSYVDAWKYVPLMVLVYSIKTPYYFYVEILFYHLQASKYLFIATLSSSLLNIVFSYFLIPGLGPIGAIAADALSMVVRVGVVVIISGRFGQIGLKLKDFINNFLIIALFITVGISPSLFKYGNTFSWTNLLFKCVVVLLYIVVVVLANRRQLLPIMSRLSYNIKRRTEDNKQEGQKDGC